MATWRPALEGPVSITQCLALSIRVLTILVVAWSSMYRGLMPWLDDDSDIASKSLDCGKEIS